MRWKSGLITVELPNDVVWSVNHFELYYFCKVSINTKYPEDSYEQPTYLLLDAQMVQNNKENFTT